MGWKYLGKSYRVEFEQNYLERTVQEVRLNRKGLYVKLTKVETRINVVI